MTLDKDQTLESPDRIIVPFWNWSSISDVETTDRRLILNETDDSDVNCSDFFTVP